jgi:hypothetical protein
LEVEEEKEETKLANLLGTRKKGNKQLSDKKASSKKTKPQGQLTQV